MRSWTKWLGVTFVVLGIVFLLEDLNIVLFNWSLYVILTGIAFLLAFWLNKENLLFILPATVLIVYGLLFFYCQISGWQHIALLWPVLLVAPGLGFLLMYVRQTNRQLYLYPGAILSAFGLLFFLRKINYIKYWPVLLIIIGLVLIVRFYLQRDKETP